MRRFVTATTITLLLTTIPASAAGAGERTGIPAEEPGSGEDGGPVGDGQPGGESDASEPDEESECADPVVSRSYTSEAMVMSLELDLVGCGWWNGEPLELVGVIGRDDGSESSDDNYVFALNACGAVENEDWRERDVPRFDKTGCAIEVALPHPAAEVAHYFGGISYNWQGEPRRVELETTCVSTPWTADCRHDYGPAVRGPGIRT